MKQMTCEDFNELLWGEGYYDTLHSEMYWGHDFSTEKVFKIFQKEAKSRNVELTDLEDWDYDKVFYTQYKNDEEKSYS